MARSAAGSAFHYLTSDRVLLAEYVTWLNRTAGAGEDDVTMEDIGHVFAISHKVLTPDCPDKIGVPE